MKDLETHQKLLLRYLEGGLRDDERSRVDDLLASDPEAREFLRLIAEQAIGVADLERTEQVLQPGPRRLAASGSSLDVVPGRFRLRRHPLALVAVLAVLLLPFFLFLSAKNSERARVRMVTGSVQYFGGNGGLDQELEGGSTLAVGDSIETRSCDAWIELELRDGKSMTIAGHSTLRILQEEAGGADFKLPRGTLWVVPTRGREGERLRIHTPTIIVDAGNAQLDVQTSETDTLVRVNEGAATVTWLPDGSVAEVKAGRQLVASLGRNQRFAVEPQPRPVNHWTCELARLPDVKLGRWMSPLEGERARLGAEPLLWPLPEGDPITLFAVAISVWTSSDRPVLLESDSRVRIRGRMEEEHPVRIGFVTQRMQGVFTGKFEVEKTPKLSGRDGRFWEVELPLSSFQPLHPQLPSYPDGLELTDIYALTVTRDVGLEINSIELLPAPSNP